MSVFDQAFAIVVNAEGGYTTNPSDPGNWTGGAVNVGVCRGTKYGISAAAYPSLDIASITLWQAQAIYERDFWPAVYNKLPAPLAVLTFDAAVNSGIEQAAKWLQRALGVVQDGQIGPVTVDAALMADVPSVAAQMLAARIVFMSGLPTWAVFRDGWAVRLFTLLPRALAAAE